MAARLTGAPIARLSVVDDEKQHFKSAVGPLPAGGRSTPLTHAICKHVVGDRAPLQIDDARRDRRVLHNGAVADDGTGAYLGAPVSSPDGHVLGSLCVADTDPHAWSERDREVLTDLAHAVETELALRAALATAHDRVYRDPLTGLGNRRALSADLEAAVGAGRPVLLILADLDGFKTYNDRFGHAAGDRMLAQLARSLQHAARRTAGRAYRMSGDEFCVMCDDASDRDMRIDTVRSALERPHTECPIGASAGAVAVPDEAITATEALELADERMYARKRLGRLSTAGQLRVALITLLTKSKPALARLGHRAGEWAAATSSGLGLDAITTADITLACELADIGMLSQSPPTRDHPLRSAELIVAIPALAHLAPMILTHHERYDGTGYPTGLRGNELALNQRIVSACVAAATREATIARRGTGHDHPDLLAAAGGDGPEDPLIKTAMQTAKAKLVSRCESR